LNGREDPIEEISRDESLVHRNRHEERERGNEENHNAALNTLDTPPLFVEEVKVTTILLPSELNSELWIKGGDKTSSTPFTINTFPTGNTTL